MPQSSMNLEGLVLTQGIVVNSSPLHKPSLDHALGNKPSSLLVVPLRHEGKILGVISAVDKTGMVPFDQLDESRLSGFASATAIALQHALTKLAHKDTERRQDALITAMTSLLP